KPINSASFTAGLIMLTGPQGAISVNTPYLFSGNTYRIGFTPQQANGTFTLTVAPGVTDLVGNLMDQNGNGINGEPGADAFTVPFPTPLPALQVTTLAVPPATGLQSGAAVTVSWSDRNAGTSAAAGYFTDTVNVYKVNPDQSLTLLATGNVPGPASLAVGASAAQSFSFHLPDGAAGVGTIRFKVTTNATNTLAESDNSNNT